MGLSICCWEYRGYTLERLEKHIVMLNHVVQFKKDNPDAKFSTVGQAYTEDDRAFIQAMKIYDMVVARPVHLSRAFAMNKYKWEGRVSDSDNPKFRIWTLFRIHNFIHGWKEEFTEEEIQQHEVDYKSFGMNVIFRKVNKKEHDEKDTTKEDCS